MTNAQKLTLVRIAHAAVFIVMTISTVAVLYAGVTGARGPWLAVALFLLGGEVVVFVGNGMRCPLTQWAVDCGAESGHVFDLIAPNWLMQALFRTETVLALLGIALIVLAELGVTA